MRRRASLASAAPSATAVALCVGVVCFLAAQGVVAGRVQWCGGMTPTSIVIAMQVFPAETPAVIVVSTQKDLLSGIVDSYTVDAPGMVKWKASIGMVSGTPYYYGIPGKSRVGTFTLPQADGFSYSIAFASCAFSGVEHPIFNDIASLDALFFIHMGDLNYDDIEENSLSVRNASFMGVFESTSQSNLFLSRPVAYMWDDHDFGPNNADGNSPGKPAAREAYLNFVPHYPLELPGDSTPLAQAFTIGRVRYLLTDLRSDASTTAAQNSTLGVVQKAWLFNELARWEEFGMMVWVSTKPWQGPPGPGSDKWRGFPDERQEIANKIAELGVNNLVMLAGDAHLVGIDDGSHTDFSTSGGAGFPLMQAAPMVQYGSAKDTGPYSHGCYGYDWWITHQYGTMDIIDDGVSNITFTWKGYRYEDDFEPLATMTATVPFVKSGMSPGEECKLPLVPDFMWVVLALMVSSVVLAISACCSWSLYRRFKVKSYEKSPPRVGADSATQARSLRPVYATPNVTDRPSSTSSNGSEDLPAPGSLMSINPIHQASGSSMMNRKPTLVVLDPPNGDTPAHS